MTDETLFSTREAAHYLRLSVAGVKYHVYHSKRLKPDKKVGQALIFTRATLDRFRRTPGAKRGPQSKRQHSAT